MASFDPKIFTRVDGLTKIANANLIALLDAFRPYLKGRGFEFPTDPADDFPHEELAQLLMVYDPDIPLDLMNGLYYIDEVASNETIDELMDRAEEDGVTIVFDGKATPADVATQIWIAKPELLMERAVRGLAFQKSSFMYFPGKRGKPQVLPNTREANLIKMAELMDPWFEKKQRGAGTRIFAFPRDDKVWLLVRHGMPMTREGKHEDDGSAGVAFYRPQKHDVMIYDAEHDLLAVNAGSKGERTLYRESAGGILFGDTGYFGEGEIFTLDPIRDDGPACLACGDIDGVVRIRLREVVQVIPGRIPIIDIKRSNDLFGALGERATNYFANSRIVSAKFGFLFEDSSRERMVNVRGDSARYDRDTDATAVEAWLKARGFYPPPEPGDVIDETDSVLEDA